MRHRKGKHGETYSAYKSQFQIFYMNVRVAVQEWHDETNSYLKYETGELETTPHGMDHNCDYCGQIYDVRPE